MATRKPMRTEPLSKATQRRYFGRLLPRTPLKRGGPIRVKRNPARSYLNQLLRAVVLHRDEYRCLLCGTWEPDYLECCHILSKGAHPELRWCSWNALAGCRECHRWAHDHPRRFVEAVAALRAGGLLPRIGVVPDDARACLEAEARRIGAPLPPTPEER